MKCSKKIITLLALPLALVSSSVFSATTQDCYIYGDETAKDIANHPRAKNCRVDAQAGIGSEAALKKFGFIAKDERYIVVSLGNNDNDVRTTISTLNTLLDKSNSDVGLRQFIIVLPNDKAKSDAIAKAFSGKASLMNWNGGKYKYQEYKLVGIEMTKH
ncbi:hypothetical protein LA345_23350 [Burkholderia vietnamiensis]|nr:hypothetical protein [Burkholderia vietnamiensis]